MSPNQSSSGRRLSTTGVMAKLAGLTVLLCFGLVVPFASTGAYLAMIPSLLLTVWAIFDRSWIRQVDLNFPLVFALAFILIAVSVAFPGRPAGSVIYVFDFLPFLLAIGLYAGLSRLSFNAALALISNGAVVGTALAVGVGCYQIFILGDHRADGIGGSAIHYANISLLLGFLAIAPLFAQGQWRWYYALGPLLAIIAALMSGSRSMIPVGGILVLVLLGHLWAGRKYIANRTVLVWGTVAVAAAMAAVGAVLLVSDSSQVDRIAAIFDQTAALLQGEDMRDNSMAIRFNYYQAGWQAFLHQPWFGYGWHQVYQASAPYLIEEAPAGAVRHLHNDILNFAVAFGIVGVAAYLLALAAPAIAWLRSETPSLGAGSYAVFCVIASYFAMGLTNVSFYYEAPKVMFCFAAAAAAALATAAPHKELA